MVKMSRKRPLFSPLRALFSVAVPYLASALLFFGLKGVRVVALRKSELSSVGRTGFLVYGGSHPRRYQHSAFVHQNNHHYHEFKEPIDEVRILPRNVEVPKHVAFILDGNGRWAEKQGLPRGAGHREGAKRALEVLQSCQALGIRTVTLYCLSTENWSRPAAEISVILACVETTLRTNLQYAHDNRIRLVVIGQSHRLPPNLQALVSQAERETALYTEGMTVCLALSYGGRDDIVQASRTLAEQAAMGEIQPQDIDEALFESCLSTGVKGVDGAPDLVIRTSGEQRWSNFMLFECAYSEFYVADVLWPDFQEPDLLAALESYGMRRRRFGGVREKRSALETEQVVGARRGDM